MREIFLGKPWHWGLAIIVGALLWWAGSFRAHVIHFNWFLIALCLGSAATLLAIVLTMKDGEQVTRDPLDDDGGDDVQTGPAD